MATYSRAIGMFVTNGFFDSPTLTGNGTFASSNNVLYTMGQKEFGEVRFQALRNSGSQTAGFGIAIKIASYNSQTGLYDVIDTLAENIGTGGGPLVNGIGPGVVRPLIFLKADADATNRNPYGPSGANGGTSPDFSSGPVSLKLYPQERLLLDVGGRAGFNASSCHISYQLLRYASA